MGILHEFFEDQASASPHATALVCGGQRLTYGEVEAKANRLARWLRAQGVKRGDCVGLWLPRGLEMHVALLAILKAGAAYVPIDPDYPTDRVVFILENCGAKLLVSDAAFGAKCVPFAGIIVEVDGDAAAIARESVERISSAETGVGPRDLCYIIYTSGSMGRPKGVQIEHRSASNLVRAEAELFQLRPDDRVYQGFSLAFDASVEEIWLAYSAGATLVVATQEMMRSGPDLPQLLTSAGVTVLSCVPTLLSMMSEDAPTVRLLILGGEQCPHDLVRRWCVNGRRMFNTYGPTEATVVATCAECHPDRPISIGRPLQNYQAYILDPQMQLLPPGVAGELYLGGVGLARGYVGLPDLTRTAFVPNPFVGVFRDTGADDQDDGVESRLYRTGDICRIGPSGEIEFLGRIDSQVKIRGFRVELSEIEAVILQHPSVLAVAVDCRVNAQGVRRIVAYVVPREGAILTESAILAAARERLPVYMVPSAIERITELPMLPSGKIDRSQLPPPKPRESTSESANGALCSQPEDAPRNESEAKLLALWRQLFSPHSVSRTDDFFLDLGGDSLVAACMVSELRREPTFANLSMLDIYLHPTIAQLATAMHSTRTTESVPSRRRPLAATAAGPAAAEKPRETTRPLGPEAESKRTMKFILAGIFQAIFLYFVMGFTSVQWLAPYLTYSVLQDDRWSVTQAAGAGMLALLAVYPAMLLLVVAAKWVFLGRVRPGSHPLWGWFYLRWWFVRALESSVPIHYMTGTSWLGMYYRLMGAKIGRNVYFGSDNLGTYDLLFIGDNTCIGADSSLRGYHVSNGRLWLGPITLGRNVFVGTRTVIGPDVRMEEASRLEDLSLLPRGSVIPPGQTWVGSPAQKCAEPYPRPAVQPVPSLGLRLVFAALQAAGILCVPLLVVAAILPGMAIMHHLNAADDYYWYLLYSPFVALSFVVILALEIAAVKWLVLGRIAAGQFPLHGVYYLRKWLVDQMLELSLDVLGPLYSTLYLAPWYRLLGAKLGVRAEVSTASFISPDLLWMDDESFIADIVSLGAPRVEAGSITVAAVRIGKRSFVGNSAVVAPGTILGDDCLIGCLSVPPHNACDAARDGTSWLGSPAVFLPQRNISQRFGPETTYAPARRLYAQRAAIELLRVILPSTGFICIASLMFSTVTILRDKLDSLLLIIVFPLFYSVFCVALALLIVAAKWLLVGRYRPAEHPLWSHFVWRSELITGLHDFLATPILLDALCGTPLLAWYFRLMGAHVGRRVLIDTTQVTEFDLVSIHDDAILNSDATLQTHLFEDRVMKMSHVRIGSRCEVGAESLVLYDTEMQSGATLGELSLLMKGETLPADSHWEGAPARSRTQSFSFPAS